MLGAVIRRELVTPLRRRRMAVFQIAMVALFGLLVAVRWPTDGRVGLSGIRSQQVFQLFAYGLLTTLLFVLPVFPATSIVSEKKRGTLALLLNTPLGPTRIYSGKLVASLGLGAIILALSLPAACACYSMGGLSLQKDLARVYLLLILVAVQYSAIGLLISSYSQSVDSAVRLTYGVTLGLTVLTMGPHYFLLGSKGSLAQIVDWIRSLSPLAALMYLTGAESVGGQGFVSKTDLLGRFLICSLVSSVIAAIWTITRLNHKIFDLSRAAGTISDDRSLPSRIFRRFFFLVDPQKRSAGIPALLNPVMVKEFRCRRFGRLHWLLRLVAVCAVLSLGLTYATTSGTLDWGAETIGGTLVVMQVALIVLITPALSAGLLSTERESGGWQLLQTTPLSTFRIVWGKLLSVILPLIIILFATLPGYIVMVYIEPGMQLQVQRVVVCLIATAAFVMFLSAAVGCWFTRTATATSTAYGTILTISVLPILIWLGRDAPFGHDTVESALTFSSIGTAMSVIRMPGFQNYELLPANWWFLGASSILSLMVLFFQTYRISKPR